ncbi:MAG: prolipoprotein diacylglyceryl transferase [Candidatus Marinimicrobia bacterium]|jgi:phosphatidylglycerol:prolipoprotein diacylglycerol transferase|nr:prolipoprotein diacylglyceryl transferase [Candidatus Neomarinimicrobiota bacterium]MBT3618562.1 prolipoprotein diacylglyceryl transferase [Candidatus Neomarinimicrobiota bacterium]MBT3828789.1 prolipoprotein diacylglyceryl transferase [Candidatus Neomarinimicrobiota bacterium]MBT3996849.1 prolipoprotein diacylglyceryl transferase [Candidatus Neomarinimicrobiota bacterium]MBT4281000.1 prolipoprotein diacylglyceryl transferase [Candidatus Neomarinimicrobiota bacterium]
MIPVLFEIGPIKIYSYGFMLVVAFYSCYFLLAKDLKRLGHNSELASNIIMASAIGGILGSKIYYLIENYSRVIEDPFGMIFSGSGLVFLGGLMGGILGVTLVFRKHKLNWLEFADVAAPMMILGYAIGRVGCFLVGDDYGIPSRLPWAMHFPNGIPATTTFSFENYYPWVDISGWAPGNLTVHPTQMYETIIGFLIFAFLWKKRKSVKVAGSLFFTYLILAGIERFSIEFIRTNPKYLLNTFSGAQVISLIMIAVGIGFFLFYQKKIQPKEQT